MNKQGFDFLSVSEPCLCRNVSSGDYSRESDFPIVAHDIDARLVQAPEAPQTRETALYRVSRERREIAKLGIRGVAIGPVRPPVE